MKRAMCIVMTMLAAMVVSSAGSAGAQATLSPGCEALNQPGFDGLYSQAAPGPYQFFVGEQITVAASEPTAISQPTALELEVPYPGGVVQMAPFPGTISYTFQADMVTQVRWGVNSGNATWTVSCQAAPPYPLAVSSAQPAIAVPDPSASDGSTPVGFRLSLRSVALVVGVFSVHACLVGLARRRARLLR